MNILPTFCPRPALLLLCLALLGAGSASAAPTNIATVPLLNITGTGNVKPNVMLLFDNSGSMDQAYTPDYINDSICRSRSTLVGGVTACDVGHPPFMSPDFNRQYYNPDIRYAPPIKYDGSYYPSMTSAETDSWTKVNADGFNAHKTNMFGTVVTSLQNLATGFPDLKWCDVNNSSSCFRNTSTYVYPTDTFRDAGNVTSNPYYYRIAVGEYCTTAALTNCKSVAIGAAAPAGYPVPVRMRWCSNKSLTTCQAKRTGSYIYAKFATPLGATVSYGTITIGASALATPLTIASVTIPDPSTARTITNGSVSAPLGTNTADKRKQLASDLAASIIAKTGLTTQYWACVNAPIGQVTVPSCTDYGLNLGADDIVAVIAVSCSGTKSASNCTALNDSSRSGWAITVAAPTVTVTAAVPAVAAVAEVLAVPAIPPIAAVAGVARVSPAALIRITGTTPNTGTHKTTITWGAFTKSNIDLGTSTSNTSSVNKIVTAIGTGGTVKAYKGGAGNGTTNTICTGATSQYVCLIDTVTNSNVGTPAATAVTNLTFTYTAGAGYVAAVTAVAAVPGVPAVAYVAPVAAQAAIPAVTDTIPTTTTAFVAGTAPPSTFSRVDIVSGNNAYTKGANRTDCAGATCTYAEEMTNFANWYSYYKTRLQMMKTSVGMAFAALNSSYKVGFVKLSAAGASQAINMVPADFTGTARQTWYTTLYDTVTSGSTPIRAAMDSVGKMFANQSPYNYAAGQEVVQYPCQQNFMILTTDGYWNGNNASGVLNNDNVENTSRFCTFARGCVDTRAQTEESISDVALYWYNGGSNTSTVSLRPSLEPDMSKPGLVPAGAGENTHLHMNTYTLGLGMDGVMTYEPSYDTSPTVGGDFYNLITRVATGCPWNANGAYVWPNPDTTNSGNTVQERVDDLWHAAINGHGKYFSANAPQEVVDGLSSAIANMAVRVGAAAAAATSTPNISQQDNDIFTDTFTTVKWYGELADKKIDIVTGVVGTTSVWNSSDLLGKKVSAATDTRTIKMLDVGSAGALKNFDYAVMTAGEKAWFDNKCAALTQCNAMSAANKAIANAGTNLVNWLRGQQQYANDIVYRTYSMTANTPAGAAGPIPIVLGDIASSKPAFVRESRKSYTLGGYSAFKAWTSVPANRVATIFTAANDGMLHAFRASNGDEMWAYAPRMTMKKLYNQASTTYGTNHQFTADGSPEVADVQIDGVWKTVLVAGLNAGGRGFYALDITDTTNPVALWELCADTTVCSQNSAAVVADIGLSFGNPQFGMWNGKWVVFLTSGYNNIPGVDDLAAGDGKGYLYIVDIKTGIVLKKVGTGSGDTGTPSGLARITSISTNPFTDPVTTHVYGGDNLGQMWRFDLTDTAASPAVTVTKMGDAGVTKPITTRPEVTTCSIADGTNPAYAQKVVLFGTGRLLDLPDIGDASVQSMFMVKDSAATVDIRGSTMVQQTLSLLGSGSNTNTYKMTGNAVNLAVKNGWYFDWNLNGGERMNLDPKVVEGGINMVTTIPSASSECSVGGSSNVYQVDVCTGSYTSSSTAVGNTLSATSAAVGFIVIRLPSGALKMITTTASGSTLTTGVTPPGVQPARNVGWRQVSGE
jgi:type IV pilus assembly protein PilY1